MLLVVAATALGLVAAPLASATEPPDTIADIRVSPAAGRTGMAHDVQVKRIYDPSAPTDGYRVLVDHIWPRGVSRERAALDDWARELAPSDELRTWFGHIPDRFGGFRVRYRAELAEQPERVDMLRRRAREGRLTILYAARDREHNEAVVLAELLREG